MTLVEEVIVSSTLKEDDQKWGKQYAIDGKISSTYTGFYKSRKSDTAPNCLWPGGGQPS